MSWYNLSFQYLDTANDGSLEIPLLCYGTHGSHLLELRSDLNVPHEIQHSASHILHETTYFVLHYKYETPQVYYESEFLEFDLSLRDVRTTFQKIIPPMYNMCMTSRKLNSLSYDICITCKCSPKWDETCSMVYYKNGLSKLVLPSCDKSAMCICSQHWNKTFDNKKKPHSERFSYSYFFTCSIYSTILKCNILEYSFRRSFMKRHDYVVYSLKRCLYHASSLSCTHRIFLTAGRRGEKKRRLKNSNDIPSAMAVNEYIEGNNNFKSYFSAGGRHQTAVSGEIVCEYLQTCTDTNLLNDKEYFKGKHFEFKRYELLGVASNNALESVDPLFYSKIPLHRLLTFLNMTEL